MKKVFVVITALALVGGIGWIGVRAAQVNSPEEGCPPGYVESMVLEPIQPGEQGSQVVERSCQPAPESATVVLEPLSPEEAEAIDRPYQPTETSPIVRGPSDALEYRCVVVLEPLQEGKMSSRASDPVCGSGPIYSVNGISLESLYLVAKFYDNSDYGALLIEYYGQYPCSAGYRYGRPDLRVDGVDNRFASGRGFSGCDLLTVYDLYNYGEPKYICGPNCPTFYVLNDAVSSWEIED